MSENKERRAAPVPPDDGAAGGVSSETAASSDSPSEKEEDAAPKSGDALKNFDELSRRYEKPVTKSAKKRKALKIILLLVMFGLSFYLLFGISDELAGGEGIGFSELTKRSNLPLLGLLLLGVLVLIIALQTAKFTYINKVTTGRFMLRTAAKINLLGKYYDNLTPSQTGGQPFQMYYMAKRGVKAGYATAIPTINYIVQMYAWQLVTLILLIVNGAYIYSVAAAATTITVLCWVGWSVNMVPPLVILLVTFSPRSARRIGRFFVRLGYKLKIVKNYKKALRKTYDVLDDYRRALTVMAGKIGHCLGIALISTLEYLTMLSIPLIVAHFIGGVELSPRNWMNMATLYIFSSYSVTFMPTPGASGFAEVSTSLAFSGIDGGVTKWMVLFLRLVIYYSYIFIGFVIIAYDFVKAAVRGHKEKKGLFGRRGGIPGGPPCESSARDKP